MLFGFNLQKGPPKSWDGPVLHPHKSPMLKRWWLPSLHAALYFPELCFVPAFSLVIQHSLSKGKLNFFIWSFKSASPLKGMQACMESAGLLFERVLFHNSGRRFCIRWPLEAFLSVRSSAWHRRATKVMTANTDALSWETVIKMVQVMKQ